MLKKAFLILAIIASITCHGQSEKRLALVVGNSEYLGKGNSLANPAHDAEDVSAKLKTLGFDVTTLIDGSLLQMKDAINLFSSKAKDYDIAFFYYSGHGLQTKGSNYMMPVDAEPSTAADIEYECYPLNRLLDKLDESNCPMKIIVLDACRNNPFTKGWYRGSAEEGLASVQSPKGTFITFATAAGSVAYDGTGRNSPYTTAFLQTLDTPNLSLFEFFNTVGQLVLEETQNKQDPWVNYSTMKGNFCFNRNKESNKPKSKKESTLTFNVNGVSFNMKLVEGGTFWMGAQNTDPNKPNFDDYEYVELDSPVHSVTLSTFYIAETEVTEALWKAVMGNYPTFGWNEDYSYLKMISSGDNHPLEMPSWNEECEEFLTRLNHITGKHFRLPTEAEWEFAARGGIHSRGYKYSGSDDLQTVGWFDDNSTGTSSHEVKLLKSNELGVYDMSGNVEEWCSDLYSEYSEKPQTNPHVTYIPDGWTFYRVKRGGNYESLPRMCRVSFRSSNMDEMLYGIGFRLALSE